MHLRGDGGHYTLPFPTMYVGLPESSPLAVVLFAVLFFRLWRLQVLDGEDLSDQIKLWIEEVVGFGRDAGGVERIVGCHGAMRALIEQLFKHPLTDIGLEKFLKERKLLDQN